MVDPFEVSSFERGVVRLFTTDLDAEGNAAITPQNVHRLLGADLDPENVEVFPSTVIEEMGLSTYLAGGYGIPESDLRGTAAKLDSMKGLVILVASRAFRGKDATLSPQTGVRFVGLFQEPGMAPPKPMTPPDSSEGHLSPTGSDQQINRSKGRFWPIAVLALLGASVLVLFVVQ